MQPAPRCGHGPSIIYRVDRSSLLLLSRQIYPQLRLLGYLEGQGDLVSRFVVVMIGLLYIDHRDSKYTY